MRRRASPRRHASFLHAVIRGAPPVKAWRGICTAVLVCISSRRGVIPYVIIILLLAISLLSPSRGLTFPEASFSIRGRGGPTASTACTRLVVWAPRKAQTCPTLSSTPAIPLSSAGSISRRVYRTTAPSRISFLNSRCLARPLLSTLSAFSLKLPWICVSRCAMISCHT